VLQVISEEPVAPRELQPTLPRDLETICLKCLLKEPTRRHASAADLADDLQRFRAGEPIHARPVSAVERGIKWVRRRPAVAALLLLSAVFLIGGTTFSSWFGVKAARRAREADDNARRADRNASDATGQAALAEAMAKEAREERDKTRRTLYNSLMNLVQVAWDADDVGRVRDLLEQTWLLSDPTELRGFEWHYWNRLSHRELWSVALGGGEVAETAFSADASRFAAVTQVPSPDRPRLRRATLRIWETKGGRKSVTLDEADGSISHPIFSPDGTRLSAVVNQQLKMWDTASGKTLWAVACLEPVQELTTSADGRRLLAFIFNVQDGKPQDAVKVWDTDAGNVLDSFPVANGNATFSPDGQRFAVIISAGFTAEVKVWDTQAGKELAAWKLAASETALFPHLTFSADGKRVALTVLRFDPELLKAMESGKLPAGPDLMTRLMSTATGGVRVWETATGEELLNIKGVPATKVTLTFSPDGTELAALDCAAGGIKVWDVQNGKEKFSDSGRGNSAGGAEGIKPVVTLLDRGLVYSRDGKLLGATGFGSILKVWDPGKGELRLNFKGHAGAVVGAAFSPDGRLLYSAGADGTLKAWENKPIEEPIPVSKVGILGEAAISADGERMAVLDVVNPAEAPGRLQVKVLDIGSQKQLFSIKLGKGSLGVGGLTFSPDGRWLAGVVNAQNGGKSSIEMKVWKADSGEEYLTVADHTNGLGGFGGLAFSRDGQRLVALTVVDSQKSTCEVKVWDMGTRKEVLTIPGGHPLWNIAFALDGKLLAIPDVGERSTSIVLRDAATGKELRRINVSPINVGPYKSGRLLLSPDGKTIAVTATAANLMVPTTYFQLWDVETAQRRFVHRLAGQNYRMAFSHDGQRVVTNTGLNIASVQAGNELKIWDAVTGMELATLHGPFALPSNMAFSPGGTKLLLTGTNIKGNETLLQVLDAAPLSGAGKE
jgi:WD40 repeat protein